MTTSLLAPEAPAATLLQEVLLSLRGHLPEVLTPQEQRLVAERLEDYAFPGEEVPDPSRITASTPFDVTLGSYGEEVAFTLRYGGTLSALLHGACASFAVFLRRLLEAPFVVFTAPGESPYWSGHVGLLVGEDLVLDAGGLRSFSQVLQDYAIPPEAPQAVRVVPSEEEFLTLMGASQREGEAFVASFDPLEGAWMEHLARDLLLRELPCLLP